MPQAPAISSPNQDDITAWCSLFSGYCAFYGVEATEAHLALVWCWIRDPRHPVECLLARDRAGVPIGLAHYRTWQWPLRGSTGCYLDDLYVDPEHRGTGVATGLLRSLRDLAAVQGWETVRWITRRDNTPARRVYDQLAQATSLVTYDMRIPLPGEPGQTG
jgi:GNAT superfamily N-acetyltransferase